MSLQHWPESERPREKLLKLGAASLSEAELLAIMLQTGTAGHSAIDVARRLLSEFRSLRGLLTAERHALCRVRGLGDAKYALLQASLELSRRHYAELMQMGEAPPRLRGKAAQHRAHTRVVLVPFLAEHVERPQVGWPQPLVRHAIAKDSLA